MLTGENGLLSKSQKASEETNKQTATEIIKLKITNAQMESYSENQRMPTLKELSLSLGKDEEITYVTEKSQKVADIKYDVPSENPSSIFTKLKEYPYELVQKIEDLKNEMVSKEQYNNLAKKIDVLEKDVESLKNHATPMIDTSKLLKDLNVNETYIATEDCFFIGNINTKPGGWWTLTIDNVDLCGIGQNGASNCGITFPSLFIKKGSTIVIKSGADTYYDKNLKIYGVK